MRAVEVPPTAQLLRRGARHALDPHVSKRACPNYELQRPSGHLRCANLTHRLRPEGAPKRRPVGPILVTTANTGESCGQAICATLAKREGRRPWHHRCSLGAQCEATAQHRFSRSLWCRTAPRRWTDSNATCGKRESRHAEPATSTRCAR